MTANEVAGTQEVAAQEPTTMEEALAQLTAIAERGGEAERAEIDHIKSTFYRLLNAEEHPEGEVNPLEEQFKAQLQVVKELRAKAAEEQAEEEKKGLDRKLAIIEEIKAMAESPETADQGYDKMKQLQAEWKEIQHVPAEHVTSLWKQYQQWTEQYYDMLRINHELRAYDFKKNLEKKTQLCEAAERLADVEDVISAFHQLQQLHEEFRATGPVAKELREEIWTRFKAASTVVNKRHQAHFETIKAEEEANLAAKTAICERAESVETEGVTATADWEAKTQEMLALQAEWKKLGFAPRKVNQQIFDRFRAACDKFFTAKSEFFHDVRESLQANLEAKTHLCERAESLKESTNWSVTTEEIVNLQKQWKEIGPVAHKVSDTIWKRFNDACNYFFEQKKNANKGQREEEEANFAAKVAVIEKLQALATDIENVTIDAVKQLQEEWNAIGHVPFRKKDKIYKQYREAADVLYEHIRKVSRSEKVDRFRRQMHQTGKSAVSELQRLQRVWEEKQQEIKTYETNLSFLNAKSKAGNSFVTEIEKRIGKLKEELVEIKEKMIAAREEESGEE